MISNANLSSLNTILPYLLALGYALNLNMAYFPNTKPLNIALSYPAVLSHLLSKWLHLSIFLAPNTIHFLKKNFTNLNQIKIYCLGLNSTVRKEILFYLNLSLNNHTKSESGDSCHGTKSNIVAYNIISFAY